MDPVLCSDLLQVSYPGFGVGCCSTACGTASFVHQPTPIFLSDSFSAAKSQTGGFPGKCHCSRWCNGQCHRSSARTSTGGRGGMITHGVSPLAASIGRIASTVILNTSRGLTTTSPPNLFYIKLFYTYLYQNIFYQTYFLPNLFCSKLAFVPYQTY